MKRLPDIRTMQELERLTPLLKELSEELVLNIGGCTPAVKKYKAVGLNERTLRRFLQGKPVFARSLKKIYDLVQLYMKGLNGQR
jgi:hypothetical protein